VVDDRVQRRSSSDNKIKDMTITMSRKRNTLCKISGVESRQKLLNLGIIRFIEMKIRIPSDQIGVAFTCCSIHVR